MVLPLDAATHSSQEALLHTHMLGVSKVIIPGCLALWKLPGEGEGLHLERATEGRAGFVRLKLLIQHCAGDSRGHTCAGVRRAKLGQAGCGAYSQGTLASRMGPVLGLMKSPDARM